MSERRGAEAANSHVPVSNPRVLRNFVKSLIAVVVGNAIYFVLLMPNLPPEARHRPDRLDLGLLIDFWICLVLYGAIELYVRHRESRHSRESGD